jgi:hypothetical protein
VLCLVSYNAHCIVTSKSNGQLSLRVMIAFTVMDLDESSCLGRMLNVVRIGGGGEERLMTDCTDVP